MERLWSPWRHEYISQATTSKSNSSECIFCDAQRSTDDEQSLVVHRGTFSFVILNRYPYISGHLMIAPYDHLAELDSAPKETTDELMDLAKRCQTALRSAYNPEGFNLGMNLGRVAGAGVADHFHLHMMPRWSGDTNFMTTVGETRVLPEDLNTTYQKLRHKI
jgi:ATP adenylyltransferase